MICRMFCSILAHKCKENKDMKEKIKSLTEELKADDSEKTKIEQDGGIRLRSVKNKTFVTAKAARKIAETTYVFKNHIANLIDDIAKDGMTQLTYFVGGICDAQVNQVVSELLDLGYEVALNNGTKELVIKW